MNSTELYAEIGKIYIQIEQYQNALQQLSQQKQQMLQGLQQAVTEEAKEVINGETIVNPQ